MADNISIADVHARDTEHDSPTQKLAWPNGHWPQIDQITSVITNLTSTPDNPNPSHIQASTGYFGGDLPAHWQSFFSDFAISPTGKPVAFLANPNPTGVVDAVAESQNGSSGNGGNFWDTMQTTFKGAWRNNHPNNSYKSR